VRLEEVGGIIWEDMAELDFDVLAEIPEYMLIDHSMCCGGQLAIVPHGTHV
jgi:hypothetical protein